MHLLALQYHKRKLAVNNFLCKYSIKQFSPQFSGNSWSELMNIDGKACTNSPKAVNKLVISAHLGHSCETGWNKHDSSYYSKQNSKFLSQGKILAILSTSIW